MFILFRYIQQYLNCVENVVKRHCEDVDAAKWQRGFDERSFLPLADHIGCVANNSKSLNTWIIVLNPYSAGIDFIRQIMTSTRGSTLFVRL